MTWRTVPFVARWRFLISLILRVSDRLLSPIPEGGFRSWNESLRIEKGSADWEVWQSSLAEFKASLRESYSKNITELHPN
jgi:hypothetical protein